MSTAESTSTKPTESFSRAVLTAVADELIDVARGVDDAGLVERLEKASALLTWLEKELGIDRTALVAAEYDLRSMNTEAPDADATHRAAIRNVLAVRQGRHNGSAGTPADEPSPSGSKPPLARKPPTVAEVTAYLDSRNGGDHAHSVRTIVGGFSKVTLLVEATLSGVRQEIVLRQIPLGRKATSLAPEFDVVSFVHGRGVPAPRPLWLEASDNALGGAFFAMSKSPGSNIGDVWGQRGASRELCLEIADLYAGLHQIPVEGLNAPVSPRSTPAELRAMIAWQRDVLGKRGITVEPVLESLLGWLEKHIPDKSPRKSLIHGDAAFSNLLVDDGHISAILDWEAAHVGDAADELAYLKPSVEPVMPWSEFLERYVSAGGIAPAESSMKFFTVWSHVWRYIGCLWLAQNFTQTGRYASAVAAYVHGPRFLDEAVDAAFA
jgi:aminoglycoside phosphotransferase (APT) family kinase protein